MAIAALKDIQIPWLTGKLGKQPKQPLIPDDLKLMDNGIAFKESDDTLDYLWYAVEEKDNGREYRGFRVVRLLELKFIPLDACADAGLLQDLSAGQVGSFGGVVGIHDAGSGGFGVFLGGLDQRDDPIKAALHSTEVGANTIDLAQGGADRCHRGQGSCSASATDRNARDFSQS